MRSRVWLVLLFLCVGSVTAFGQSTSGTISGRVIDAQKLPIPGVTATVTSPTLQGTREAVTSTNGDYILTLLPSGVYVVQFELSGFGTQMRTATVAPTQVVPLDVEMGPAGVTEPGQARATPAAE